MQIGNEVYMFSSNGLRPPTYNYTEYLMPLSFSSLLFSSLLPSPFSPLLFASLSIFFYSNESYVRELNYYVSQLTNSSTSGFDLPTNEIFQGKAKEERERRAGEGGEMRGDEGR